MGSVSQLPPDVIESAINEVMRLMEERIRKEHGERCFAEGCPKRRACADVSRIHQGGEP